MHVVQKLAEVTSKSGIHMAVQPVLQELFRKALAGKQDKLVDEITVDSGLWTKLKAKNVLSGRQIGTCEKKVLHYILIKL